MKRLLSVLVVCTTIVFASCTEKFEKAKTGGIEFKIVKGNGGKQLSPGKFMQIHIVQSYKGTKDTILSNSRDFLPRIEFYDSSSTPEPYFTMLKKLTVGDSLVIRVLSDSAFKNQPQGMPPFVKKGKYLYTTIKLLGIFDNQQQVDSANKAEYTLAKPKLYKAQLAAIEKEITANKTQIEKDSKIIEEYLAKNNIKAQKAKWGTYVEIKSEGVGDLLKDQVVSINYTGKTLDSNKVFDSNIETSFGHAEPYKVNLGQLNGVIPGWFDGLFTLKNQSKAVFYIPSSLAYGAKGNGAILPNQILKFDIDVVKVETEEEAMKANEIKQAEMQKQMMEEQKKNAEKLKKGTK